MRQANISAETKPLGRASQKVMSALPAARGPLSILGTRADVLRSPHESTRTKRAGT